MKTLALRNGDLVVTGTGHQTISGSAKIRQELALALGEEFGADKYHPTWGSILNEFFGKPIDELTQDEVRTEVARVIQAYIAVQQQEVLSDHLAQRASRFHSNDVVTGLNSIDVSMTLDTIFVSVDLQTASGQSVTVSRTVQS